jgi:hypothetical protein
MTSAMSAYWGPKRMVPRDDAEFGVQLRRAIWKAVSRTSTRGPARDKVILTMLRNQHPKAFKTFPETALLAAARELEDTCSWCAFRQLAALAGEPPPRPSDGLYGLLGSACRRCRDVFDQAEATDQARARLAAGGRRPTGTLWPASKGQPAEVTAALQAAGLQRRTPEPSYYRRGRP